MKYYTRLYIKSRLFRFVARTLFSPKTLAIIQGVKMGKNCLVLSKGFPSEGYLVEIGDNVQITGDVKIFTHGGAHVCRQIDPTFDLFGRVKISDNVYVGNRSLIMPGVSIGEGALIAAGSVVTKSVPAGMVVGGNPARIICSVSDYYDRNKEYNAGSYGMSPYEKYIYLTSESHAPFIKK